MDLKSVSTDDLNREIKRRTSEAAKLYQKRDQMLEELAALDERLNQSGGDTANPRRSSFGRRLKNAMTLGDALAESMEIRAQVSPAEAADLVIANGYQTVSRHFNMMVSNTLAKDSRFRRVSRGQYERVS
jgi:hypothetical protein